MKIIQSDSVKDSEHVTGDTRERILSAAEKLFIARGFDGVSISDVAAEAGITKGLVFYYFKSKRELTGEVLDKYYRAQKESLLGAMSENAPVREKVHSGIDAYIDFIEQNPGYPRLIQREICSGGGNLDKIIEYMKPLYAWGMAAFGSALPGDGELSARHFFISVFGMVINYYTYAPVLDKLLGENALSTAALAERRAHVHSVVDTIIDRYVEGT